MISETFQAFAHDLGTGLIVGIGLGIGVRLFDWFMTDIMHEGSGHHGE